MNIIHDNKNLSIFMFFNPTYEMKTASARKLWNFKEFCFYFWYANTVYWFWYDCLNFVDLVSINWKFSIIPWFIRLHTNGCDSISDQRMNLLSHQQWLDARPIITLFTLRIICKSINVPFSLNKNTNKKIFICSNINKQIITKQNN